MLSRKRITIVTMVLMTLFVCLQTTQSYAWWSFGVREGFRDDHRHYDHRPHFGMRVSYLPDNCYNVWYGGERYNYCDGYYYRRDRIDYVVVNPPVGTVLATVPVTYQPVVVNGFTYYVNNGVYYVYTSSGYQVVPAPQPVTVVQSAPVVVTAPAVPVATTQVADDNSFTVNIPNDKGGYTEVIIKKSGNGFVGPQGEFYAEFPKVAQLKTMYVK